MGSNAAMRALTQQYNAKIQKNIAIIGDHEHYHRSSKQRDRDLDREDHSEALVSARNLFARKPMEMCRNGICVGERVTVLVNNQVLTMVVSSFEHGARAVLIDKRGYFHWVEPVQLEARVHNAQFVTTMSMANKRNNGYKPHPDEIVVADIHRVRPVDPCVNRRHSHQMR